MSRGAAGSLAYSQPNNRATLVVGSCTRLYCGHFNWDKPLLGKVTDLKKRKNLGGYFHDCYTLFYDACHHYYVHNKCLTLESERGRRLGLNSKI